MDARKSREDVVEILIVRRVRTDPGRQDRDQNNEAGDDRTRDERLTVASATPETRGARLVKVYGQRNGDVWLGRLAHRNLILGSRRAAVRSVTRLINTTLAPSTM